MVQSQSHIVAVLLKAAVVDSRVREWSLLQDLEAFTDTSPLQALVGPVD